MEEVLGKMLAQGIEVWWPEEGDQRKGATAERTGRWDEEEAGYDNLGPQPDKYLGVTWADRPLLQSGPSGGRVLQSYPLKKSRPEI